MNADQLAQMLLSGGSVGDLVHVRPVYPGVGEVAVRPVYPGVQQVGLPVAQAGGAPQQQVEFSQAAYVAGDVTYLGFGSTSIPASSPGTAVQVLPLRPFTPQKMGNPSTNIGLLVSQVQISGTNIFSNNAGVPIELFSEVSTFPQIIWPTLDTATGVTFVLINPTGAAIPFQGGFYGTQVRR
jgi:hypothetical protein